MDNVMDINIREDGVYLCISHPPECPKISRIDVLNLIESYGVADVDFVKVNDALKNDFTNLDLKISNNVNVIKVNESAAIEISMDRMEAYITFSEPVNKGSLMTLDDVMKIINDAGIVNVDRNRMNSLLRNKRYARQYTFAVGTPPVKGTDGFLQYHFDNSNLRPKPKIMEDGSVNFRDLGLFRLCNKGDVLVTSVPPQDGVDGVDVCGRPIACTKGRLPLPLPRGKNASISADGLHLLADVSGQLVIQDSKINISPCLDIKGNVDNSTGDIDFNGMVTISGNVISGFKVKAVGNIEVRGVCEAATLISSANIVLGNGAQGADRAELMAGGDITAKFIEGCKVTAGGNVVADSILKSHIKCNGSVILSGKNGLLVGGTLIAGSNVTAKTIGSPMGTQTEIEVGNNPQELIRHKELVAEYERLKKDFEKYDMAINALNAMKKKDQLTDDKKELLLRTINGKMAIRDKMSKLQQEIDEVMQLLTANAGVVSANKVIRPGVRVIIGNAQLLIHDDIQNCTLRNKDSKITISPCV